MSEQKPTYITAPAPTDWRAQLADAAEAVVRNPHRPAVIVLRYDGAGHWQIMPAQVAAKVSISDS